MKWQNPLPPFTERGANRIIDLLLEGRRVSGIAHEYGVEEHQLRKLIERMIQKWPDKLWPGFEYAYEQGELGRQRREERRKKGLVRSREQKRLQKEQEYANRVVAFIKKGPKHFAKMLDENYIEDIAKKNKN